MNGYGYIDSHESYLKCSCKKKRDTLPRDKRLYGTGVDLLDLQTFAELGLAKFLTGL